jgi:hypothetical protein
MFLLTLPALNLLLITIFFAGSGGIEGIKEFIFNKIAETGAQ